MPSASGAAGAMTELEVAVVVLAGVCVIALALPHLLPLHRVAPLAAARVWLAALTLRAFLSLGVVVAALVWIHHISKLAPAIAVASSVSAFVCVMLSASFRLRRELRDLGLGTGPGGSLVTAHRDVYVALTGVGPVAVLVSAGALDALDGPELRASLAHEHGHRTLNHRVWAFTGAALLALARPLPAGAACERGLRLALERQADEYAVRRTGDPLALASAICKAAHGRAPAGSLGLATTGTVVRLDQLMADGPTRSSSAVERAAYALVAMLLTLASSVAVTAGSLLETCS